MEANGSLKCHFIISVIFHLPVHDTHFLRELKHDRVFEQSKIDILGSQLAELLHFVWHR